MRVSIRGFDVHIRPTSSHEFELVFDDDEGRKWISVEKHHSYGGAHAHLDSVLQDGCIHDDEWNFIVPPDALAWTLDEIEQELEV